MNPVEKVKAGDLDAYNQMCQNYMPLAKKLAKRYYGRFWHIKDDLLGAAYVGLVQAVAWVATDRFSGDEPGGYIRVTIIRFLNEEIERNRTIRVPRSVFRKNKKDGKGTENIIPKYSQMYELGVLDNSLGWVAVLQKIDHLPEKEMILLRIAGYTFKEISVKMEVSETTIFNAFKGMKNDY